MKAAVVVFPGINRERDMARTLALISGREPAMVWHADTALPAGTDLVVIPGGFSYGDYLRCGAIAARAPIMDAVRSHAEKGGLVLAVCNGFQIVCEAGLLPGVLQRNAGLRFVCRQVHIRVETTDTPFTAAAKQGQVLQIPIAHGEGNYFCEEATLAELERNRQIVFRYTTPEGREEAAANPNGSLSNIAGVCNRERNVLGLMPHPERAAEAALGSTDGVVIFRSLIESLMRRAVVSA